MNVYEHLAEFSYKSLGVIASQHGQGKLTTAQKLSLLIGLCGVRPVDLEGNILMSRVNQTFTLVYTDPISKRSNYQTVCVPEYTKSSPFVFQIISRNRGKIRFLPGFDDFHGINLNGGIEVRIHSIITNASNHYYSRVDPYFNELPTAIYTSAHSTCAGGCTLCSRAVARTFTKPSEYYISEHVDQVHNDFIDRAWNMSDLWSVSLNTGSHPLPEQEINMILTLINEYRLRGFQNAHFHIFTYQIQSEQHMLRLIQEPGVIGYIGTIETFDDERRLLYWGKRKGAQSFEHHRRRYHTAHQLGYPIVETNYVVGTDSYDMMQQRMSVLNKDRVAVVPNIMRNYNVDQLEALHPDLWDLGFRYIVDGFEGALATYQHPTIKSFAGGKAVEYLNARGLNITFGDLPVRHT